MDVLGETRPFYWAKHRLVITNHATFRQHLKQAPNANIQEEKRVWEQPIVTC